MLAVFDGFGWTLAAPREGCLAWVRDERVLVVHNAGRWQEVGRLPAG
jgi:hypothetical protein